jgi:membrane protein required for colicin V production
VALFDWIAVALIAVSMLFGLMRGLVFEVMSLIGWVAAFIAAQWLASGVAAWVPFGEPEAAWRYPLAFVLVFVGVVFGVGLWPRSRAS